MSIIQMFVEKRPVVADGGWGTQLQLRGLPIGHMPDLWNLSCPEKVENVAKAYVDAGSEIVLTNTFGSNRFILARHGKESLVRELNASGVKISKKAAAEKAKVFASMGPSGIMLLSGDVSQDDLYAAFLEQAEAFAEAGADGIVVETMSDPAEASIAVRAAKSTGLPVVASMTFDSGKNKDRTMMGTTPEQAAEKLAEAGADVIGANCGQGIEGFVQICARLKAACDRPIWIKANAGLPEIVDGQTVYLQSPEAFAEKAKELISAGATFIGGCCGTSPDFIRALSALLGRGG